MQNNNKRTMYTLFLLGLAGPVYGDVATFVGVGFHSAQNQWSECTGISDSTGMVSGTTKGSGSPGETQGFYWTKAGGMVAIGNPPLSVGSPFGGAHDISGDGFVLAGTTKFDGLSSAGFNYNIFTGFTPLAPTVQSSLAEAFAINGDGTISVGETRHGGYVGALSHTEATLWLDDGTTQGHGLGLFPGGTLSTALGVSRNGKVVVGEASRAVEEGMTAFRWDDINGFVSLGDLPGGYHFSRANAASEDGAKIVGYGTVSFNSAGFSVDHRACYWDSAGVHELPNLPGSTGITEATDITPDGQTMVGWARYLATNVPVIWDDVHGVRNLYEVMIQAGVDMSSWGLGFATAVSADGKTIVGYGYRGNPSVREGWVCTLP